MATEKILRRFSLSVGNVDDQQDANVVVGAGATAKEDGNISDGPVVDVLAAIW